MNQLFALAFVLLLAGQSLFATSRKTPADRAMMGIAGLIEIYQTANPGRFPESLSELSKGGYATESLLDMAREYCDIENRYVFVDLKPIRLGNRTERILLMAKQAGGEGDDSEAIDPGKVKGRLLIVEASDGSIRVRQYSEVMLKAGFEKAGLNLTDYTSDVPPTPEHSQPPIGRDSEGVELGEASRISGPGTGRPRGGRGALPEPDEDSVEGDAGVGWWVIGGLVVLLSACAVYFKAKKSSASVG